MGAFVLGILVGWLAEWLFFTFVMKADGNDSDCSQLKAELAAKNKQITSLQDQLSSSNTTSQSVAKTKATPVSAVNTGSAKASGSKKTNAKQATAAKTTTRKKTKSTRTGSSIKGDDFTKLSGIGPSMSETLKSLGIDTFQKLASTDDDILRDMLEASGARMNNNKEVMDTWNEQATVAAKGDFETLKRMQSALKK